MSSAARIEELQKKFDENPRRYFAPLANECRKAGDLDAAIAICRTHLPQQPGHMSGHIVYGQALFESGELDEARTVFETALGLDPENLIALRHMGDIAARHGDLDGARQWYVRVLETDPRNEEIQSLVSGLDHPGAVAHVDALGANGPFDDTPVEFLEEAPADAEDLPRVRGGLPTLVDPALLAAAADAVPDGGAHELEAHAPQASDTFEPELLDLGDAAFGDTGFGDTGFVDGRLTTTEMEAASAADTARDELLEPTSLEFEAPPVHGTLEGLEATTFEPPAAGDVAQFERVGDEALMDEIDTSATRLEGLESAEFDASGYGGSGLEPIAAPSFDFEPVDAGPLQDPPLELPPQPESHTEPQPEARSGEAFVTETMAELYLRQGYREEAMGVYRKLVSQSPHDAALRSRMERLEREFAADAGRDAQAGPEMDAEGDDLIAGLPRAIEPALVAAAAEAGAGDPTSADQASPSAGAASGPTIREFLFTLASGAPLAAQAAEGEIADVVDLGAFDTTDSELDTPAATETQPVIDLLEVEPLPDLDFDEPAGVAADFADPEPLATDFDAPGAPAADFGESEALIPDFDPSDPVAVASDADAPPAATGDGLDAMFGSPDADDLRSADALAAAYLPQPDLAEPEPVEPAADPLRGRPARPAGNDLSLDHVFGAPRQQGSPRNTGGFSFDQFFAEGAVKPAREDAPDQPAAAGDEEDLEQFNSWLHNLRKP